MADIYNWKLYCETESKNVTTWSVVAPTSCPNNNTHTIDSNSITVIDSRLAHSFVPIENTSGTQGFFQTRGYLANIAPGPNVTPQLLPLFSRPYNVRVFSVTFMPNANNVGDTFSLIGLPGTDVGVLTSPVSSGNILNVSPTVLTNMQLGFAVTLNDGVTSQDLGECTNINVTNSTITTENSVANSFNAGTTNVLFSVRRFYNITIASTAPLVYGLSVAGGSFIPQNTQFQIQYINQTGIAKTLSFSFDIIY